MVIAVALVLASCSGDAGTRPGTDSGTEPGGGEAEIGTGMFAFAPLADGERLDLVSGPQGGFHFVVHARMRGLAPGDARRDLPTNPTTWFRVLDENGTRVDIPEVRQLGYAPQNGAEGWYILPSGRILLIENAAAPRLYGRPVTIEVQIRDAEGRMAGDTARITAVAYPPAIDAGVPGMGADAGPDTGPGTGSDAAPAAD